MAQIKDFHTFSPLKKVSKDTVDHTFMPVHMCFMWNFISGVNHGWFWGGGIIVASSEYAYCGVAEIYTTKKYFFLGKRNYIDVDSVDYVNYYLHGSTKHKIYTVKGP